jgi:hypothetical protein
MGDANDRNGKDELLSPLQLFKKISSKIHL